jgi:hypothetical protein
MLIHNELKALEFFNAEKDDAAKDIVNRLNEINKQATLLSEIKIKIEKEQSQFNSPREWEKITDFYADESDLVFGELQCLRNELVDIVKSELKIPDLSENRRHHLVGLLEDHEIEDERV